MPPSTPPPSESFPSYEEVARFLSTLAFDGGGEDTIFAWQTHDDKPTKRDEVIWAPHGSLQDLWQRLVALNADLAGVHVGIHETDGEGRTETNIRSPRAVVLDFDTGEPPTGIACLPISMVVRSAAGPHLYWLLQPGQDLQQWRRVQLAMARRYGGDEQASLLTQTMRVPGFFHHKKDPTPVYIELCEARRYTLDEIIEGYHLHVELRHILEQEAENERRRKEAATRQPSRPLDSYANRLDRARSYLGSVAGAPEGSRNHHTARQVVPVGWRFGIERDAWLDEVLIWNESHNSPPLPDREVRTIVHSMWKRMERSGEPFGSALDEDSDAWKAKQAAWEEQQRQRDETEEAMWTSRFEDADRVRAAEAPVAAGSGQPGTIPALQFLDLTVLPCHATPPVPDGHPLSVRGNTQRFIAEHGPHVRHCEQLKQWFLWTGTYWRKDHSNAVCNLAQQSVGRIHLLFQHPDVRPNKKDDEDTADHKKSLRESITKHVCRSEKPGAIKDMLEYASWQRALKVQPDELDADDLLVNTPSGIVDVSDLSVRRHDAALCQTRITSAPFVQRATCDRWRSFVRWAMCEDEELISFIQRAAGVSMTGSSDDHVFFVCFGIGGNGKSTFVNTMLEIANGYGKVCDFNMFLQSNDMKSGQPNEELLALKDVRMVFAAEPEEGRRLKEDVIKRVTGGEPISARPLFGKPIEFKPKFSLWLSTNHRPSIRGTDDGIWRRVVLIPWQAQVTDEMKDTKLAEKLRVEHTGILRWIMEGANAWHRDGLQIPDKVRRATHDYREDMDVIGAFLQAETIAFEAAQVGSAQLYDAYRKWCEAQGEKPFKQKTFSQRLGERGFEKRRSRHGIRFMGLGLMHTDEDAGDADDDEYGAEERRAIQQFDADDESDDEGQGNLYR